MRIWTRAAVDYLLCRHRNEGQLWSTFAPQIISGQILGSCTGDVRLNAIRLQLRYIEFIYSLISPHFHCVCLQRFHSCDRSDPETADFLQNTNRRCHRHHRRAGERTYEHKRGVRDCSHCGEKGLKRLLT